MENTRIMVVFDEVIFSIAKKYCNGVVNMVFEGISDEVEVTGRKQQLLLDLVYLHVEILLFPLVIVLTLHLYLKFLPIHKLLLQFLVANECRKDIDEYLEAYFDSVKLLIMRIRYLDLLEGIRYVRKFKRPHLFEKNKIYVPLIML